MPTQEDLSTPLFSCPSGNCTFDPFTTLALCSRCADITPQLSHTCSSEGDESVAKCKVAFPGKEPISLEYYYKPGDSGVSTHMVVNSTSVEDAVVLNNQSFPLTVYQSISAVLPPDIRGAGHDIEGEAGGIVRLKVDQRFVGSECALSPCAQQIKASVSQGVYAEEVIQVRDKLVEEYEWEGNPLFLSPPWLKGKKLTIIPDWIQPIARAYDDADPFGGKLMGSVVTADSNSAVTISTDELSSIFYADFNGTSCGTPDDHFACAFRALGAAATKAVRDAGVVKNGTVLGEAANVAEAAVYNTVTIIQVEWLWGLLPLMIWVLSAMTVLVAMIKSWGMPLWRDSVWPLVLLAGDGGAVRGARDDELKTRAETVGVQLVGDRKQGLKLLTKYH